MAIVIAVIPTSYKPLHEVACLGKNEAWICGFRYTTIITRIGINGKWKASLYNNIHIVADIAVNVQGDLVYIYGDKGEIKGHPNSLTISIPQNWRPYSLCCSRSGDVLVSMSNGRERKIIRYHEKEITQEIHKDENGALIFEKGNHLHCLRFTENNNRDICISDDNAGVMIVVNLAGKVRFRYDGKPAKKNYQFRPRNIVTDSLKQIIIADYSNSCLHIIDQDGKFLKCVDDCGLDNVHALSVDDEGRLWAGLSKSGIIKVIQYLE